ncbi:LysR family transcriptional regulator [Caballeronia sp. dw_276]|jgi:DNA-binding transcriptional LysR family regulator|uniref:LysR family transcriptional regulator n=1 Tax=Caballeronia sp. dw_276 TaxID=2719795 RepID=UPI001BD6BE84|nr:LysR family transcriptional regulator [Caballeronia sp. dw_276]
MKLDDIEAFVAVVRCQSLTLASEWLETTQPAVTRRIQSLEEALGVELLDRKTKPLKPTPTGRALYEQCRVIVREFGVLRGLVASNAPLAGLLRIGVVQTVAELALVDALRELKRAHPDLKPRVSTGWGGQLLQQAEEGAFDAAIMLLPSNQHFAAPLSARSLGRIDVVIVAGKGVLKPRVHRLKDLHQHGWVLNPDGCGFRAGLQRTLAAQGLPLKINLETLGSELQLGLVADGIGLGLVPLPLLDASDHAPRLEVVKVGDFDPAVDAWLVQPHAPGKLQVAIDALASSIQQSFDATRITRTRFVA